MKVGVFGAGYVGLTTAAGLAEKGNEVFVFDVNRSRISELNRGQIPIHEPGLDEIIRANSSRDGKRLSFTTDVREAIDSSRVIICAVGTPSDGDGRMNLDYVWNVVRTVEENIGEAETIFAVKSTVPPETTRTIQKYFDDEERKVIAVSNPEFLVEGRAVDGMRRPDRIVVGTDLLDDVKPIFDELYGGFLLRGGRNVMYMNPTSAELAKFASNGFLAAKLSFINVVANYAEKCGADVDDVRRVMGSDHRIGVEFLFPGQGYGGSCFPKDVPELASRMDDAGVDSSLMRAVGTINDSQRKVLAGKVLKRFGRGGRLDDLRFALWGTAFKAFTDDVRESPALVAIDELVKLGARISAYDPQAMKNAASALPRYEEGSVEFVAHQYLAVQGADALLISTEWDCFRNPDFGRIRKSMKNPIIFDGRNMYDLCGMENLGFEYYSIGRRQIDQGRDKK